MFKNSEFFITSQNDIFVLKGSGTISIFIIQTMVLLYFLMKTSNGESHVVWASRAATAPIIIIVVVAVRDDHNFNCNGVVAVRDGPNFN